MLLCCSSPLFLPRSSSNSKTRKDSISRGHAKPWSALTVNASRRLFAKHPFFNLHKLSLNWKKSEHNFAMPKVVREDQDMTTARKDVRLGIFDVDPSLEKFKDHFNYRLKKFEETKSLIEKFEGSLEEFSQGYMKFGFNREQDGIVYREWAPAAQEAQLIGDFNGWDGSNHRMERNEFGVWSIKIRDSGGNPSIPHNSRVKFRFKHGNGIWVDRIPAWIRYATVDPTRFAAPYDGVHWDPPPSERYVFKYPRPPKPEAPRIYEAHVGMSDSEQCVSTYREFADNVLPRIRANNYNTIQLMAVMEHSYYASFGYHVTNFFAGSSRSGTPEDLKYLVDKAHGLGLRVLMDVVHSHASNNPTDGLNGFDVGQSTQDSYFHTGERGYHKLWDSRLFNYANWEVLRFLLSNLRWWLDEFKFDGFRFDGVTSMLFHHHGIDMAFTGNYMEYFSEATDVDAVVYMMLVNQLVHNLLPDATVIAEDVSGMPALCRPVYEGGVGFDYRLAMAIPDKWIDILKNKADTEWSMKEIVWSLTNRRYTEKCVAYAESHDQAIVGDKTISFLLMDEEMYSGMSDLKPASPVIERGISLHKMIHLITMALGGEGYLNFMGNEFGHPEWIDFPREGNGWSYDKCRRQWSLVDTDHLRYKHMNAFDRAMNLLDDRYHILSSAKQVVSSTSEEDKVIAFERGDLVFVFNFHPENTYNGYKVGCDLPGKYRVALDSDAFEFGGHGRVGHDVDHFTSPEGIPGVPETNFNNRPNSFKVLSPARACVVYYKVDETLRQPGEETTESEITTKQLLLEKMKQPGGETTGSEITAKEVLPKASKVETIESPSEETIETVRQVLKDSEVNGTAERLSEETTEIARKVQKDHPGLVFEEDIVSDGMRDENESDMDHPTAGD
ncbi:hypothetical protein Cni_G26057 [Canna indica]|uniref:1,4-alpha-glucan branching enzyme n=1 Tax=Canna indica TaxID=4628 RepID=A0AAQ3KY94_9LILI|nr:hypothetical protein Cni_G26057 [Canna indica]